MDARAKARYVAELTEGRRRAARNYDCPSCGAPCYRGEDADMIAITVTVDTEPIGLTSERMARASGLLTYDLLRDRGKTAIPGSRVLWIREPEQIKHRRNEGTIHVEHRCNVPTL